MDKYFPTLFCANWIFTSQVPGKDTTDNLSTPMRYQWYGFVWGGKIAIESQNWNYTQHWFHSGFYIYLNTKWLQLSKDTLASYMSVYHSPGCIVGSPNSSPSPDLDQGPPLGSNLTLLAASNTLGQSIRTRGDRCIWCFLGICQDLQHINPTATNSIFANEARGHSTENLHLFRQIPQICLVWPAPAPASPWLWCHAERTKRCQNLCHWWSRSWHNQTKSRFIY